MAVGLEWGSDGFDTAWCGFGLGLGKSETNAVFQTFSSSKATARFFCVWWLQESVRLPCSSWYTFFGFTHDARESRPSDSVLSERTFPPLEAVIRATRHSLVG